MFALRVRYRMGRVYAAAFDEGDMKTSEEWPPHPSRLFSALTASWGEGGAEPEVRPALKWLETQPPPALHYGPASERALMNVYVPVNDSRGSESLPEERSRKGRSFPSASLPDPEGWFVWQNSLPPQLRPAMNELLRRTPSLGHSASVVAIEAADSIPATQAQLAPDTDGDVRLRVPPKGRLTALERRFNRFQQDASKVHRPDRGATALYRSRERPASPEPARGIFREMLVFKRVSGERIPIEGTLAITVALRGALLANADQPPPEIITGHAPEKYARASDSKRTPSHFTGPLPFVGSRHSTGELLGAAVVLPLGLTAEERAAILSATAQVQAQELRMPFGAWTLVRSGADEPRANLREQTWSARGQAWATVTPYVFDRFPGDPYGTEAQETVCLSFERAGFPRPASVSLMKTSVHFGVPPSSQFPAAEGRPGKPQRFHLHVLVTFDRPVAGPMIAGAGRFYGYGLFRLVKDGL